MESKHLRITFRTLRGVLFYERITSCFPYVTFKICYLATFIFQGVVDLIEEQAIYNEGPDGAVLRRDDIPEELRPQVKDLRQELIG